MHAQPARRYLLRIRIDLYLWGATQRHLITPKQLNHVPGTPNWRNDDWELLRAVPLQRQESRFSRPRIGWSFVPGPCGIYDASRLLYSAKRQAYTKEACILYRFPCIYPRRRSSHPQCWTYTVNQQVPQHENHDISEMREYLCTKFCQFV